MKKIFPLLSLAVLLLAPSCSSKDDLTPSHADQNYYEPAADDNSALAQLQRDFFSKTTSYLLFNDTLNVGDNGKVQVVDMNFSFIGSDYNSYYKYTYKYLTDIDTQRRAADLVRQKLCNRLGKAVPYSFLVVDSISWWERNGYGSWSLVTENSWLGITPHPTLLLGDRCYAISINGGEAFTNDAYFDDIVTSIIENIVKHLSAEDMKPFLAYTKDYYMGNELQYPGLTDQSDDPKLMHPYGFFMDNWNDIFPSQEDDVKLWAKAMATYTPAQFAEEYGAYPVMMSKYNTLRQILEAKGVKFND